MRARGVPVGTTCPRALNATELAAAPLLASPLTARFAAPVLAPKASTIIGLTLAEGAVSHFEVGSSTLITQEMEPDESAQLLSSVPDELAVTSQKVTALFRRNASILAFCKPAVADSAAFLT